MTIGTILALLAARHRVLTAYPYPEAADIDASLAYAASSADG